MSNLSRRKVAVITGANTGLGYTLAQRLVTSYSNIRLCLACRSKEKATQAATNLSTLSPDADIDVVILDTSSIQSVYSAAEEIRKRYDHIDLLYLNAGTIIVKGVDWNNFWQGLFSSRVFYMFMTGEGLLRQEDSVTEDGLQTIFETNVFGHYVLIKELEDRLGSISGNGDTTSQLIWTSSFAASEHNFDLEDFQHKKGKDPYGSSKYATDIVSTILNNKLNKQLRIFVPSMTNSTLNGTEALVWLSQQDPRKLDPLTKYQSAVSMFGKPYVDSCKMNIDPDKAEQLRQKLDLLDSQLKKTNKSH